MAKAEVSLSHQAEKGDWRKKVVYQIYPRSFQEGKNAKDGNGNLDGIIERLDYLKNVLQVDAVWMSPVYRSPLRDGGYDVADYVDIDPMYGDLETMDRLIDEVHSRDMQVIMDFVPNHTSDQHPWFQQSRSSKDNPKRDWYHWHPGKADGSPPNNWITIFDNQESAWTRDEPTNEYYLHNCLKEQPDLNWSNPAVEAEMYDTLAFWMDRGVDGFRVDVGLYIMKDPRYPDEPLNPEYVEGRDHPHDILVHKFSKDTLLGYMKLSDIGNEITKRGGFAVYESYVGPEERRMLHRLPDSDHSVPMDFDVITKTWDALSIRRAIFDYYAILRDTDIVPLPLGNHDQSRVATRLGSQEDARLAATLQMTLDCIPFIYQGEELGMEDVAVPLDKRQDPSKQLSRDAFRTPMQWDARPNAGFTAEGVDPWLPVAPDYATRNVESQIDDPQSMLSLYRRLLSYRKETLAPGRPVEVDMQNDKIIAYTRKTIDGKDALVMINFSDEHEQIHLDSLSSTTGALVLNSSLQGDPGDVIDLSDFRLNPKEAYILQLF